MAKAKVKKLIFSSSASVYGTPAYLPSTRSILSDGKSVRPHQAFLKEMLNDLYRSDDEWRIGILRYFNPVGAHESGLIEDPLGIPNHGRHEPHRSQDVVLVIRHRLKV
ncbi:NAD-dependent epimerase/dehydratase family protein [Bradyrhizobium sp. USDA 4486]